MIANGSFTVPWNFCKAPGLRSAQSYNFHVFFPRGKRISVSSIFFSLWCFFSLIVCNLYLTSTVTEIASILVFSVIYLSSCFESINRSLLQNVFTDWKENFWLFIMCNSGNRRVYLGLARCFVSRHSDSISVMNSCNFTICGLFGQVMCVCACMCFFQFCFQRAFKFLFISTEGLSIPIRMRRAFTWWTSWCFQWKEQKVIPPSQGKDIKH